MIVTEDDVVRELPKNEAVAWWRTIEPVLLKEWEEEKAARTRWTECNFLMRDLLCRNCIFAYVLENSGSLYEVPAQTWLGNKGGTLIATGIADLNVSAGYGSHKVRGPVILNHDFLDVQKSDCARAEDDGNQRFDPTAFPYLTFMIRAAKEAPFQNSGRTSKKIIEAWIESNWPSELGDPTTVKINYMATFLRKPADEKGGNTAKG